MLAVLLFQVWFAMSPTAEVGRFNHAALECRDVVRSVAFYRDVLGFREVTRPPFDFVGAWLYRDGVGMMLHLIEQADLPRLRDRVETRSNHLAFAVADYDGARSRLLALGLELAERRLPGFGYRQMSLLDPDGHVIELGEWPDVESHPDCAPAT